jgi:predicted DNA-binding transcriptional regulator AlpA
MRAEVYGDGGQHWTVRRDVLTWRPRPVGRGLVEATGFKDADATPPDVTASTRVQATSISGQGRGLVYLSCMVVVVVPLLAVQATAWLVAAAVTLAWKTARQTAWDVVAEREYPGPKKITEQFTGWRASSARACQLAQDLSHGNTA